jgi:hypothetical protein
MTTLTFLVILSLYLASDLNRAIGRSAIFNGIDSVSESNVNGLYKATYFERVGKKV